MFIIPDLDCNRRTVKDSQKETRSVSMHCATVSIETQRCIFSTGPTRRVLVESRTEKKRERETKKERQGNRWLFRRLRSLATCTRLIVSSSRQIDIVSLRLIAVITQRIYNIRARESERERARAQHYRPLM